MLLALTSCGAAGEQSPDVILIVVDTLRADRLAAYGSSRPLTPHLDALAAESLVFEHAYAPSSYTLPSVVGLLSGLHPEEAGIDYNTHRLREDVPTIAEILRERGWRTGAVISNYVLRERSGVLRGFDEVDIELEQGEAVRGFPDRTAEMTTDAALRMWQRLREPGGGPRFLWVHYQDPHGPYTPPPGYREALLGAELDTPEGQRVLPASERGRGGIPPYQLLPGSGRQVAFYRAGYDGEVRHTDEAIGELLEALRGQLEDAIVIFTADHGEALGEANLWFAHGELLIEPLVRVPLMIRLPGRPGEQRPELASLLDVLPTLAGLLGIPPPSQQRGVDLLAQTTSRPPVYLAMPGRGHSTNARFALIGDGYKYAVEVRPGGNVEQLSPLGSDRPLREDADPERIASLREQLEEIRSTLPDAADPAPLTAEDQRGLEALGYLTE